ncbi:MAG: DinB family protein [Chloroflexota bacterium]
MNALTFRLYYEYHFAENRKLWDTAISTLSNQQFIQNSDYSVGSVRNQFVHLMSVDEAWFSGLTGLDFQDLQNFDGIDDQNLIRAQWDKVEQHMRDYLAKLQDTMLFEKPFADGEDKDLILWQVLLHVVNHGTDHRAQLLRLLNDLGAKTTAQDYIFYAYDHP